MELDYAYTFGRPGALLNAREHIRALFMRERPEIQARRLYNIGAADDFPSGVPDCKWCGRPVLAPGAHYACERFERDMTAPHTSPESDAAFPELPF